MSATSGKGAESIRVGLLSYAHVGHAVAYSAALKRIDGVEFVAIYDEDEERGRAMASRFDVPEYHADAAAVIGRGDIQAVVVCSPTADHASLVTAAAEAGKHILCEKPIATRVEDANAMIAACEAAGVQLHIPFVLRFLPMAQRAKQMVAAGEIGEIYGMMGGNRGIPPLPPAYPGWITDPKEAGGGALIDHSVHVTDAMRFITGAEATRVFAECGTLFREELRVDDAAILLVTFDDEIAASIDPSWCIPKGNPYHYDFYLRILGADGVIAIDETRSALQVTRPGKEGRSFVLEGFGADANLEVVRHFVRCVREGEQLPPAASGVDGLRALEIALAGYESARTGQPVMLGGVVAS
jgi:predicted dehydrogenase